MTDLFTIGYEGAALDDFIATLQHARVEHVVDVRELPQSRRRGFSKNGLAAALRDSGIQYTHVRQLGDPKPGREAARKGDYPLFREIFSRHLSRIESQEALSAVLGTVLEQRTVLMCYERNPKECHRTMVASALESSCPLNVRHLGVVEDAAKFGKQFAKAA